jgi:hypothetical protein
VFWTRFTDRQCPRLTILWARSLEWRQETGQVASSEQRVSCLSTDLLPGTYGCKAVSSALGQDSQPAADPWIASIPPSGSSKGFRSAARRLFSLHKKPARQRKTNAQSCSTTSNQRARCRPVWTETAGHRTMKEQLLIRRFKELRNSGPPQGTLQFTPENPIPSRLVKKIVAARM